MNRTPLRKKRPGTRRGEPTPAEKQAARIACFTKAHGLCHWCGRHVSLEYGQLCHLKAKRRFGWVESEEQQHLWGCAECHSRSHNCDGKPVPSKGKQ